MKKYSIDIFRGMFLNLPKPFRALLTPVLAAIPAQLKFGGTYRRLRKQIRKSERDAVFVSELQEKVLWDLFAVLSRSTFYADVIRENGIQVNGSCLSALDVLRQFPILTKDILRERAEELLTVSPKKMDIGSTSGTSGRPVTFFLDKDRSVKEWAFVHHVWSRAGYKANDKRAVIRGVQISNVDIRPWEYDAALRELRLSPFHLTREHIRDFFGQIRIRGIKFLHGYPSALSLLANRLLSDGKAPCPSMAGIFPISESMFPHQRTILRRAFPNALILPFYGLSEKVAFAGEVEGQPDVYEFEPLYGFAELVDKQGQSICTPGERGRIVATGLLHFGMPLVRYDTEDEGDLIELPSGRNCFRLRVSNIKSRWSQEFVVGREGQLISMAAINVHSSSYSHIKEFQLYQDTPGVVEVRVVPLPNTPRERLQDLINEIQMKVGTTAEFRLVVTDVIQRNTRGKLKFIDQRCNLSQEAR